MLDKGMLMMSIVAEEEEEEEDGDGVPGRKEGMDIRE